MRARRALDRFAAALCAAAVLLIGCASSPPSGAAAADDPIASGEGGRADRAVREMSVTESDADGRVVQIEYDDVTGRRRVIRAELRLPDEPSSARLPVLVWSHGGSQGFRRTGHVGDRWGIATNQAGMAFVAIAHPGRPERERQELCDAVRAADCSVFNPLMWDRPHDVAAVLDWIEVSADDHGLDVERIVHGGHSAGAIGALTVAGMEWSQGAELVPPSDPRPIGFLAASPPGAAARSLDSSHFAEMTRPVLFLTGLGDETSSTAALDRRATFSLVPPTIEAAMLWIDRPEARHGMFDLNVAPCERAGGAPRSCRHGARMIADVGVGFVAAVVDSEVPFDAAVFVDMTAPGLPESATLTSAS